ncbi:hypothetical protein E3U26_14845 (plasmid) [Paracoccus ferrooxidans]|nr:hypothetical protein E3U26_14845 [Paracoccus ferrooxidans]
MGWPARGDPPPRCAEPEPTRPAPSRRSRDRRRCSAASSDRTAVLAATICQGLAETRIIVERWRCHENTVRPHGSLGYKPPAREVFIPAFPARTARQPGPATPSALETRPALH